MSEAAPSLEGRTRLVHTLDATFNLLRAHSVALDNLPLPPAFVETLLWESVTSGAKRVEAGVLAHLCECKILHCSHWLCSSSSACSAAACCARGSF